MQLFLLFIIMIILVGCNAEAKKNEADAERIATIEEKVKTLFNEKKDDIDHDLTADKLHNIEQLLHDEDELELSEENEKQITTLSEDFHHAKQMYTLQVDIENILDEQDKIDQDKWDKLANSVETLQDFTSFYDRQSKLLDEAHDILEYQLAQEKQITKTEKALQKLFKKEKVRSDVTQGDYDYLAKMIKRIDDNSVKNNLTNN